MKNIKKTLAQRRKIARMRETTMTAMRMMTTTKEERKRGAQAREGTIEKIGRKALKRGS